MGRPSPSQWKIQRPILKHSCPLHPGQKRSPTALTRTRPFTQLERRPSYECTARETSPQQEWQQVRPHHWWRKICDQKQWQRKISAGWENFKEKVKGQCFNCLSTKHFRAQCREPTKCWRCKNNDHTSHFCKVGLSVKAPDLKPLHQRHHTQTTVQLRQEKLNSMERRCSFGGASADAQARDDWERGRGLIRQSRGHDYDQGHSVGREVNAGREHERARAADRDHIIKRDRRSPNQQIRPAGLGPRVIDYPGNPRFRPVTAMKASSSHRTWRRGKHC